MYLFTAIRDSLGHEFLLVATVDEIAWDLRIFKFLF